MPVISGQGTSRFLLGNFGRLLRLVTVTNAEAVSSTQVRVHFNHEMTNDAALSSAANYAIAPNGPNGATVVVMEVQPQNTSKPLFVDLVCSEMTNGESYTAIVSSVGPVDTLDTNIDEDENEATFTGEGAAPTLNELRAVGQNRIDVVFSEQIKDNADSRNPANYVFNGGLKTLNVLNVDGDTVQLVTSDQEPGELYTLTIG